MGEFRVSPVHGLRSPFETERTALTVILRPTSVGMELMQPNKSDALLYLDGPSVAPARYARVTLDNRTSYDPVFRDILVGPLPINNKTTTWRPLEYHFNNNNGGKVRNIQADSSRVYSDWITPVTQSIQNITHDLWNTTVGFQPGAGVIVLGIDPLWQDDGRVKRWDAFLRKGTGIFDVATLLPQGLYFKSDITGRDPEKWKLEGWFYNGIWYDSTEAFQKAYWSPGFEKIRGGVDGDWARPDRRGDPLPLDALPPPVPTASSPPRFSVDVGNKYVEWMGFSFYMGFSADTGLSFHDIRYEGQRIIYELGLQEALAHYSGMARPGQHPLLRRPPDGVFSRANETPRKRPLHLQYRLLGYLLRLRAVHFRAGGRL